MALPNMVRLQESVNHLSITAIPSLQNKTRSKAKQICEMPLLPEKDRGKKNQAGIPTTHVFQPHFEEAEVVLVALVMPEGPHALLVQHDQPRALATGRERLLNPLDAAACGRNRDEPKKMSNLSARAPTTNQEIGQRRANEMGKRLLQPRLERILALVLIDCLNHLPGTDESIK